MLIKLLVGLSDKDIVYLGKENNNLEEKENFDLRLPINKMILFNLFVFIKSFISIQTLWNS